MKEDNLKVCMQFEICANEDYFLRSYVSFVCTVELECRHASLNYSLDEVNIDFILFSYQIFTNVFLRHRFDRFYNKKNFIFTVEFMKCLSSF